MQYTHHKAKTFSDKVAYCLVKFFQGFADVFSKKGGNRAIVLGDCSPVWNGGGVTAPLVFT